MVNFSFNNPPLDNIAFLMSKKLELHFDYDEIKFEAHQRAFTVAKVTQIDLLSDIQTSLENAFVEGQSYQSWVKELKPTLQKHGWLGKVVVQNPDTKDQKEIFVGASRLKKIFYTNTRTAYQQSRARAQEQSSDEYLRYVCILDSRTRHTHAALHGLILKKKDPFWEKNYPPNGWNCRCAVEFISKDEMIEQGFKEMSEIEKTLNFAEKDWDYDTRNLEKNDNGLQLIIENKLKKYVKNQSAREALELLREQVKENRSMYERIKGFYNEVKALSSDEREKRRKESIFIAKTDKRLREKLGTSAEVVRLSVNTLSTHFKHEAEGITPFDYALIRHILSDENANIEKGNKDRHIVYFSKYGVNYKAVLKTTDKNADKDEVYLVSLITIKRSKAK